MTRKLKKEIWPYHYHFKHVEDEEAIGVDNAILYERQQWLFENFKDSIRNRVYVIESSRGVDYYFKNEQDYNWFIWRWV